MVNVMANLDVTFQCDGKMSTTKLKSHLNLTFKFLLNIQALTFSISSPYFFLQVIIIHSSLLSDSMPFEKVVSNFSPVACSWSAPSELDSVVSNIEASLSLGTDASLSLILDAVTALTHFLCIVFASNSSSFLKLYSSIDIGVLRVMFLSIGLMPEV